MVKSYRLTAVQKPERGMPQADGLSGEYLPRGNVGLDDFVKCVVSNP